MKKSFITAIRRIQGYLTIAVDRKTADKENFATILVLLGTGFVVEMVVLLAGRELMGQFPLGAAVGISAVLFMLAYYFLNRTPVQKYPTLILKGITVLALMGCAFFEVNGSPGTALFLYPILLLLIPPMILDKPWKILVIIWGCTAFAFICCTVWGNPELYNENVLRLLGIGILSSVVTCRLAHQRIQTFQERELTQAAAEHDPLTGLLNRGGGTMLIRSCVEKQEAGAFIILDIDDFKHVNDNYGHQKGDEVLQSVARVLRSSFKAGDIVMRMGGDEFIIYAVGMVDYNVVCRRLEQLVEAIHEVVIDAESGRHVTVSIGCCINDDSYPTYESLYKVADRFLYKTKQKGKDGFSVQRASYG